MDEYKEDGISIYYDVKGDVLEIIIGEPRVAISEEVESDIFVRVDPKSRQVVGISILNFNTRFSKKQTPATLPIRAQPQYRHEINGVLPLSP